MTDARAPTALGPASRGVSELPADRCTIPRVLWRSMAARGLPIAEALTRACLPAEPPDNLTTAQYFAFFRALEALADDPALGIALVEAAEVDTAAHPPVMLAAFHAPNYRAAIERLVRFKRLIRAEEIAIADAAGEVSITKTWLHTSEPEPSAGRLRDGRSRSVSDRHDSDPRAPGLAGQSGWLRACSATRRPQNA